MNFFVFLLFLNKGKYVMKRRKKTGEKRKLIFFNFKSKEMMTSLAFIVNISIDHLFLLSINEKGH